MSDTFALTSGPEEDETIPVTNQEEKELRRVFERLCDFDRRNSCAEEIVNTKMAIRLLKGSHRHKDAEEKEKELELLEHELNEIKRKTEKKISVADVFAMMKTLKAKVTFQDVQEAVWEVDEDLDQYINWNEMKLMYTRNLTDKSGLEPSKIFNLAQFLIYDKNENNRVSVDETMNMLYARYGRSKMEIKLKELFGVNMLETGREGGEITFQQFVAAVDKVQLQTFRITTKGKNILLTSAGKRSLDTLVKTLK